MSTSALSQSILEKLDWISLPKINFGQLRFLGFILTTFLLIFYIFQVSSITKASFSVSRYEQEIIQLSQQNKNLEISLSQENSLANLEAVLKGFDYEKVSKVYYIRVMDSQVAVNLAE